MHRALAARATGALALALTLVLGLTGPALVDDPAAAAPAAAPGLTARWSGPATPVATGDVLTGTIEVGGAGRQAVTVEVSNAEILTIPRACRSSTLTSLASSITPAGDRLTCRLRVPSSTAPVPVDFRARVAGALPGALPGAVTARAASSAGAEASLAPRRVLAGGDRSPRRFRFVSSPDFLNADVADLRRGPGFWKSSRSTNGINARYRRALDTVLDDWRSQRPDEILVAGDLVQGRWGGAGDRTGNFGPVRTHSQRRAALKRAAATYYPQWLERFTSRGLVVRPAMGDHEYGDNPWPRKKRVLARLFEREFARHVLRGSGSALADRPRGSVHARTAYAWRPHPSVQMVTLNVFDIEDGRARVRVDRPQLRWLERVLGRARADGVPWTVVQAHTPILGPNRVRGSSALRYQGGRSSALWRLFERYGVDLYLAGEVHDVTATRHDGIVQVAHGGLFQYGLTNYLLADVHDDRLSLRLVDYQARFRDAGNGSRLWENQAAGLPKKLTVGRPSVIGTLEIDRGGEVRERSGILLPWRGRA